MLSSDPRNNDTPFNTKSKLVCLEDIFKTGIFRVPDYQRGYAWTKRQLEDFWDDLVNLPSNRFHYTGLLSLRKVDNKVWENWKEERSLVKDRGFIPFHIVDGQQRLTTFVIFIQVIYEKLKSIPENKDKKDEEISLGSLSLKTIKEEYLVIEEPPEFTNKTYKFGYEVDNPSFKFLREKIFLEPHSEASQETFYTLNLEKAKEFFKGYLDEYYKENGLTGIEALFTKVTQNLMFNVYVIDDDFDVFVAFETMNNRGKPLSTLELLKNRLIYLTTLYKDEELQDNEKLSLRDKINDAWKEIYHQLGRNKENPLDDNDFLRAHWIIYFQYTRKKANSYNSFLLGQKFTPQSVYGTTGLDYYSLHEFEEVREDDETYQEDAEANGQDEAVGSGSKLSPEEIKDYVDSLQATAGPWYRTYYPKHDQNISKEEIDWLERLNRIGINYFRPLVTASFLGPDISPEQRGQLFKAIERFIFIVFRMSRSMANFGNSEFYRKARELRTGKTSVEEVIGRLDDLINRFFFYQSKSDGERYFKFGDFKNFLDRQFNDRGGFYAWNGLRYFLYEYEMEKALDSRHQKIDWEPFVKNEKDKVSIEHIYPQTPTDEAWKKSFGQYKEEEQVFFQGTLGNLLALSQSINSSLQNNSFAEKVQGYSNGSDSAIEVAKEYKEWNPDSIRKRGMMLLKFMEERWNLKFENEDAKEKLLFLDFMKKK